MPPVVMGGHDYHFMKWKSDYIPKSRAPAVKEWLPRSRLQNDGIFFLN